MEPEGSVKLIVLLGQLFNVEFVNNDPMQRAIDEEEHIHQLL